MTKAVAVAAEAAAEATKQEDDEDDNEYEYESDRRDLSPVAAFDERVNKLITALQEQILTRPVFP